MGQFSENKQKCISKLIQKGLGKIGKLTAFGGKFSGFQG